jgi:hypothetical protein
MQSVFNSQIIEYTQALKIAVSKLKTQIASMTKNGKLKGEIYILLVQNPINVSGEFYWYVALKDTHGKTFGMLIDPISEKILAESI